MQRTVKRSFKIEGIGLHSGDQFTVDVMPAPVDTGVRFRRTDVRLCDYTRITPYNVSSTQLATTIDCDGLPISTIEHLMAGLYGMGIDNAFVDVSGPEVPILDGSALPVVQMIKTAGIVQQEKKRQVLRITRPVSVSLDGKTVDAKPSNDFIITFELDYSHPAVGQQVFTYKHDYETYEDEIALARTFGFSREVDALRAMGLARGGSLDNAIVIGDETGVMNPEGLRRGDEFVRHKILDMYGDLSLIGYRIIGDITAVRSGHHINNVFARALLEATNSYEIVEEPDKVASNSVGKRKSSKSKPLYNLQPVTA